MKQRYTLMIADMEIDVISEASSDEVENIVGILDRKIRDILLKSRRCSKNEAALLSALEFCADKLTLAEENRTLGTECADVKKKLELAEARIAALEEDNNRLRRENEELLHPADRGGNTDSAPVTENVNVNAEPLHTDEKETPKQDSADDTSKKPRAKSKVGSMFDLLTFTEI